MTVKGGFIVLHPTLDPTRDRTTMGRGGFELITVGVALPEQALEVARALVAEGVVALELCSGFGPQWTARILEATGGAIPVGAVSYGIESIAKVCALMQQ